MQTENQNLHKQMMKDIISQLSHVKCTECGVSYHWSDLYADFPLSPCPPTVHPKWSLNHPWGKLGFPRQIIECPDCYICRRRGY